MQLVWSGGGVAFFTSIISGYKDATGSDITVGRVHPPGRQSVPVLLSSTQNLHRLIVATVMETLRRWKFVYC